MYCLSGRLCTLSKWNFVYNILDDQNYIRSKKSNLTSFSAERKFQIFAGKIRDYGTFPEFSVYNTSWKKKKRLAYFSSISDYFWALVDNVRHINISDYSSISRYFHSVSIFQTIICSKSLSRNIQNVFCGFLLIDHIPSHVFQMAYTAIFPD